MPGRYDSKRRIEYRTKAKKSVPTVFLPIYTVPNAQRHELPRLFTLRYPNHSQRRQARRHSGAAQQPRQVKIFACGDTRQRLSSAQSCSEEASMRGRCALRGAQARSSITSLRANRRQRHQGSAKRIRCRVHRNIRQKPTVPSQETSCPPSNAV